MRNLFQQLYQFLKRFIFPQQNYTFVYFYAKLIRKRKELHLRMGNRMHPSNSDATIRNNQGQTNQSAIKFNKISGLSQFFENYPSRRRFPHFLQRLIFLHLGTFSPLIGYGIQSSLQFGFNRFFRKILAAINGQETTHTLFLAGILTGIPSAVAITPADHMRILMQKQSHGTRQRYTGQWQAAKDIISRHGPKGLYLGFSTTLLREFLAMSIYFTTFEKIKKHMEHDPNGGIIDKLKIMFAGALAGLGSWIIPYPIDFVKTKMQSQNLDCRKYKNSWNCFILNYKETGWRGFTRGLWTVCLRSIPVNSMAFLVEQQTANLLGRKHVHQW